MPVIKILDSIDKYTSNSLNHNLILYKIIALIIFKLIKSIIASIGNHKLTLCIRFYYK